MCSRCSSVVLEGGCGIFHPRGVCITWLPYFAVAGIENQLRKWLLPVQEGKMGNHRATSWRVLASSARRSCSAACAAVIFLKWSVEIRELHSNPPLKLGERDQSSKTKRWAGGGAWKTIVNIRHWIGTCIKWRHGCVAIDFSARTAKSDLLLLQRGLFGFYSERCGKLSNPQLQKRTESRTSLSAQVES